MEKKLIWKIYTFGTITEDRELDQFCCLQYGMAQNHVTLMDFIGYASAGIQNRSTFIILLVQKIKMLHFFALKLTTNFDLFVLINN